MKCNTQHNDAQHNGTQNREILCCVSFMLSVTKLNVVMLSVVMLSVVAPSRGIKGLTVVFKELLTKILSQEILTDWEGSVQLTSSLRLLVLLKRKMTFSL